MTATPTRLTKSKQLSHSTPFHHSSADLTIEDVSPINVNKVPNHASKERGKFLLKHMSTGMKRKKTESTASIEKLGEVSNQLPLAGPSTLADLVVVSDEEENIFSPWKKYKKDKKDPDKNNEIKNDIETEKKVVQGSKVKPSRIPKADWRKKTNLVKSAGESSVNIVDNKNGNLQEAADEVKHVQQNSKMKDIVKQGGKASKTTRKRKLKTISGNEEQYALLHAQVNNDEEKLEIDIGTAANDRSDQTNTKLKSKTIIVEQNHTFQIEKENCDNNTYIKTNNLKTKNKKSAQKLNNCGSNDKEKQKTLISEEKILCEHYLISKEEIVTAAELKSTIKNETIIINGSKEKNTMEEIKQNETPENDVNEKHNELTAILSVNNKKQNPKVIKENYGSINDKTGTELKDNSNKCESNGKNVNDDTTVKKSSRGILRTLKANKPIADETKTVCKANDKVSEINKRTVGEEKESYTINCNEGDAVSPDKKEKGVPKCKPKVTRKGKNRAVVKSNGIQGTGNIDTVVMLKKVSIIVQNCDLPADVLMIEQSKELFTSDKDNNKHDTPQHTESIKDTDMVESRVNDEGNKMLPPSRAVKRTRRLKQTPERESTESTEATNTSSDGIKLQDLKSLSSETYEKEKSAVPKQRNARGAKASRESDFSRIKASVESTESAKGANTSGNGIKLHDLKSLSSEKYEKQDSAVPKQRNARGSKACRESDFSRIKASVESTESTEGVSTSGNGLKLHDLKSLSSETYEKEGSAVPKQRNAREAKASGSNKRKDQDYSEKEIKEQKKIKQSDLSVSSLCIAPCKVNVNNIICIPKIDNVIGGIENVEIESNMQNDKKTKVVTSVKDKQLDLINSVKTQSSQPNSENNHPIDGGSALPTEACLSNDKEQAKDLRKRIEPSNKDNCIIAPCQCNKNEMQVFGEYNVSSFSKKKIMGASVEMQKCLKYEKSLIAGYLKIDGDGYVTGNSTNNTVYFVIDGKVEVSINEKVKSVSKDSCFMVARGTRYTIKNITKHACRLSFVKVSKKL